MKVSTIASDRANIRGIFQPKLSSFNFKGFSGYDILSSDSFEKKLPDAYKSGMDKLQKVTKNEYDSLSDSEKFELRHKIKTNDRYKDFDADVMLHQFAAEAIRQVFDKEYGKGSYVVVPVGRSLSSISRLLAMKIGEENVKNIPMSSMQNFYLDSLGSDNYSKNIEHVASIRGFSELKAHLDSIGLSKEAVVNSGKKYIIMDYECSGMSLKGAYTILTSNLLAGNEKRNFTYASINDIANSTNCPKEAAELYKNLELSKYKKYSFIDGMNADFTRYKQSAEHSISWKNLPDYAEIKKLFGFALIDNEFFDEKKRYKDLTINPVKEKIPHQDKRLWLSPQKQYNQDLEEDAQEVFKLIRRIKNLSGEDCSRLEKFLKQLEYFERKMSDISIGDYYINFRPKMLKTLSLINENIKTVNDNSLPF